MDQFTKIVHCDCDSFFASVEIRDNPALQGSPVAIGGSPNQRGVVATCNYEARKYGIHSAMPMHQAVKRCPNLHIIKPDIAKYRRVSRQINKIYQEYTKLIEPLSLDEAFLDVTLSQRCQGSATMIASEIRAEVSKNLGITISAGIAPNKFLAKIASDWNKPNGQFTITPGQVSQFIQKLPVHKIFGVGSVTAAKLHALGIKNCEDLQKWPLLELTNQFGRLGARLYELCRGIDNREVIPHRLRKSVSVETTYTNDLIQSRHCFIEVERLATQLFQRIEHAGVDQRVSQYWLKLRFSDFRTTTASEACSIINPAVFDKLLEKAMARSNQNIRLIGLGVKISDPLSTHQMPLFKD
ncbi:MAG: DNA polymerase IV [Pseudomonadales bacterium]|nr:DNA polymerase IV [Pseudomonadales bacterium]